MPTLRMDMSECLRGGVKRRDELDKNLFEILLSALFSQLCQRTFRQKLAALDDAYDIAQLFDFTHNVSGEDDGFSAVAAFADESDDASDSHDVEAKRRLVKDHHRRVVD